MRKIESRRQWLLFNPALASSFWEICGLGARYLGGSHSGLGTETKTILVKLVEVCISLHSDTVYICL
jgi:hypothetical protein